MFCGHWPVDHLLSVACDALGAAKVVTALAWLALGAWDWKPFLLVDVAVDLLQDGGGAEVRQWFEVAVFGVGYHCWLCSVQTNTVLSNLNLPNASQSF